MADDLPRDLDGNYRLLSRLGDGGMGEVYLGENVALRQQVAVKVMLAEQAEQQQFRERFAREARAAARIQSAHVVEVHYFSQTDDGELFLVMELLDGVTLDDELKKGPLHPWRAIGIAQQICRALQAVHEEGIVHRDLKGANIMLLERDGIQDFVKLLDFGIAKLTEGETRELTATGAIIGTLSSMAPEQITGQAIDARTDVYALGVLMYRMLTGRQPFSGRDTAGMAYAHVHEAPPRPTVPGLSPALVNIVMQCLAKNPDDRFTTMKELAEALLDQSGVERLMGSSTDAITVAFDTSMRGGPSLATGTVSNVFASSKAEQTAQTSAGHVDPSVQAEALSAQQALSGQAALDVVAPDALERGEGRPRWARGAIAAVLLAVLVGAGTFALGRASSDADPGSATTESASATTDPTPVTARTGAASPATAAGPAGADAGREDPADEPTVEPTASEPAPAAVGERTERPRTRRRTPRRRKVTPAASKTETKTKTEPKRTKRPKFNLQYTDDGKKTK